MLTTINSTKIESNEAQSSQQKEISTTRNFAVILDQMAGAIGGAESILFALYEIMPNIPAFTTVLDQSIIPEKYKNKSIYTSLIQKLPFAKQIYKAYLPIMPFAVEMMDVQKYDVIFSSHHCVAKGIIPRPDAVHICYCHSPARYIWDMFWTYTELNGFNFIKKIITGLISHYFRIWDSACSNRVDLFLANSNYTAARIKNFYNREAYVLYPPVDTNKFKHEEYGDYYLMVGRLVAYKGYELAIEAFNKTGKKLVIIGDGAEYKKLRSLAKENIKMVGKVSDETLIKYMNNAKGFIFPGKEDFGIVMVEAQSAGKPVIAFKAGGALDIVQDNKTGILFEEQTANSLNDAILRSELNDWDSKYIWTHAKKFDKEIFKSHLKYILENANKFKRNNYIKNIDEIYN